MKLDLNKELVLWKHVTWILHKEPCDSMHFERNTNLTFKMKNIYRVIVLPFKSDVGCSFWNLRFMMGK